MYSLLVCSCISTCKNVIVKYKVKRKIKNRKMLKCSLFRLLRAAVFFHCLSVGLILNRLTWPQQLFMKPFARRNRVSAIPAISLKNKIYNEANSFRMSSEKEIVKDGFKKSIIHGCMKHYIKVWRLLFDVCLAHVEREKLLNKWVLFYFQGKLLSTVMFLYRSSL